MSSAIFLRIYWLLYNASNHGSIFWKPLIYIVNCIFLGDGSFWWMLFNHARSDCRLHLWSGGGIASNRVYSWALLRSSHDRTIGCRYWLIEYLNILYLIIHIIRYNTWPKSALRYMYYLIFQEYSTNIMDPILRYLFALDVPQLLDRSLCVECILLRLPITLQKTKKSLCKIFRCQYCK